ncbi:hypothetical protein ACQP2F_29100 [Actinoplanes sp. CA-030573]|uniref:hypothetical protein n=1 Tax=Actinoplanes sp. CA-030573 TaxID=3239898 RepID=UPI003D8A7473
MMDARPAHRRVEASAWRERALTRAAEIEGLLAWFQARGEAMDAGPIVGQVAEHLGAARYGATRRPGLLERLRSGAELERVEGNLDAAEVALLTIAPEPYVRGQLRTLVARVRRLPLADPHRTVVEELARRPRDEELSEADRAALESAVRAADAEARRDLARVRTWGNVVTVVTLVVTVFAVGLAMLGAVRPELLPLCFAPGDRVVCPTGEAAVRFESPEIDAIIRLTARPYDVAVVEVMGMLGGLLAAVVSIRRFPGRSIPYNPTAALGALKLPAGALSAVLGLVLIGGQFIPGFSALDTPTQILAWALVFGIGQQLFTRVVDNRALQVLTTVEAPADRESADLDESTAEAFNSAVTTTLRSAAPRALRDAIARPRLVNYAGWLTLTALDDRGRPLERPPESRELTLVPGERYTLRAVIGHASYPGWVEELKITNGVDQRTVNFAVEIHSNDRRAQQPPRPATVGAQEGEATVDFPLEVDESLPQRWLWVRVRQGGRIVLQTELQVLSDGQP